MSYDQTKQKPSVLEEEEEEEELQLGDKPISAESSSEEIAEPETRENIKQYIGKLLLISKFTIRPVLRDNKFMYVSYIDGCIVSNDEIIEKIKEIGVVDAEVKKLITEECEPVKLYSTSAGIALSLNSYVKDALNRGKVLVEISTKKSKYPQDIIVLKNPFS